MFWCITEKNAAGAVFLCNAFEQPWN